MKWRQLLPWALLGATTGYTFAVLIGESYIRLFLP